MSELKPCPFCNSGIKPSPGLPGVYQHAENVDTCIIGDLGIKDIAAWNRRADWAPETRHARDCAYVTSVGPAPCTCEASSALSPPVGKDTK